MNTLEGLNQKMNMIYIRRKNKNSEEIVLLDVNELAHGKDFYQLANWSILARV